jgi:2-polyprenyl-3-methyl-5-hydroxy-6-metoxy-1,4-benzoquinol methylase
MTQYQETEGLLSSRIRNIRLTEVASSILENSSVLDLGCGSGQLRLHLPGSCKYYGIDRVTPSHSPTPSSKFINLDLFADDAITQLREQVATPVDYITCIAFLEHIAHPAEFLAKFSPLLRKKGRLVGTTPHPRGRIVHDTLAKVGLLSRSAAEEHETFLGEKELLEAGSQSGGKLIVYKTFLFKLNQLFIIEY